MPSSTSPTTPMDEEGDYYNEKMLQYVHFVHCVSMLERLLLHKKGRELFPVELPGRNGGSVELGQQLQYGNNSKSDGLICVYICCIYVCMRSTCVCMCM